MQTHLSLLRERTRSAHSALQETASWNSPRVPYMPQPAQFSSTSALSERSDGTDGAPNLLEPAAVVVVGVAEGCEEDVSCCFPGEGPDDMGWRN